jgi:TolA-binding protein
MNSQKGKDKEEITKLKSEIAEINKKNDTEINNYKEIIKELSSKIETLQNEIFELKKGNQEKKVKEIKKSKIEIIYSNSKLLFKIISYLENKDKFNLSKCNGFLYKSLYYKALSEKIYNKLLTKEKIIKKFENEDLTSKFEVKEKEILELFRSYIINQKVSGIEMRNEIVKSLIFLETHVKIPLANFKSPNDEKENIFKMEEPKKKKFFSKFFSALKTEIKEEIGMNNPKNEIIVNNNFISFQPKEYVSIFNTDRHVLETFKTDKSLNVKFDYKDADKIKEIINEFFICQLPQASYQKFISKISETFSDLLYASFIALNDIKNLEIIVYALYCRYMHFKLKIEDLQSVIEDLNHYAESSKQIKEMLTKSKNEVEFKYTNSMMTISQLNSSLKERDEEIKNVKIKMKENEEKYNKFKNDIIKEYTKIKDDFSFTKKERDLCKGILNELKDFFVKVVTGELLN